MEISFKQNSGLMETSTVYSKFIIILAIIWATAVHGQQERTYEWYAANFPKEHAVKLIDETNIIITIDDDEGIKISRNLIDEKLLLSNTANGFKDGEIMYSSFFYVRDVEAAAYLPKDNGSYSRKKIKDFRTEKAMSDHVFHDDNMAIRFQYPDLRQGSKIALSYTEDILNPFFLPPAYLQDVFFTEKIKVTLQVPIGVQIKIDKHHIDEDNLLYTREERKGIVIHTWEVDSVKQFDSEGGAPDPKYFVPHLTFIVEGYERDGQNTPVLRSVADLYNWYNSLLDSVDHTLTDPIKETIDSIKAANPDELSQAKAMFNWVRGSIKYIAVEDGLGGFIPDNPANVSRKRFGDCKGMSCLLATMMRYADMDARECWIGTRDIPYSYEEIYTPFVDNHMITAYNYKGTWYFLDPTDEYVPFGYPSSFIQGKEALIGLPDNQYTLQRVPVIQANANMVGVSDTVTIVGTSMYGKAVMTNTGYSAARFKRLYRNADKKDRFFKYYLESGNDKFSIDGEPVVSIKDTVIEVSYKYHLPDYTKNFDGKYFINLNTDRILSDDTFEDRKLPLERDNEQTYRFKHTLIIPDGYQILAVPENFSLSNDFANVSIVYEQKDGVVDYTFQMQLTELMIEPEAMEAWNNMIKELRKAYRKNVELQKIN